MNPRLRRLTETVGWYLVAAWAVIQVADVVGPALNFPPATVRWLIYTAIAGLPIVILIAIFSKRVASPPVRAKAQPMQVEGRPTSPKTYELYLQANQLSAQAGKWEEARQLYEECVRLEPKFAPAWARLARCHRLLAKFDRDEREASVHLQAARECFERALSLEPDLSLAHSLYAQLEVDLGKPELAMVRLLARATVGGADAQIYAGLVQACRFCGLLHESVSASDKARRLDPTVRTSVAHTHFMLGDYDAALQEYRNADIGYLEGLCLAMTGKTVEAVAVLKLHENKEGWVGPYIGSLRALLEGQRDESIALMERYLSEHLSHDGEAVFYLARQFAYLGEEERALAALKGAISSGFVCHPRFIEDPWLDSLRNNATFRGMLHSAETRSKQARESFEGAGGEAILN